MMSLHAIGERELAAIDGARGLTTEAAIREISPVLADNLVQHAFGRVFARTTLSRRDREMARRRTGRPAHARPDPPGPAGARAWPTRSGPTAPCRLIVATRREASC